MCNCSMVVNFIHSIPLNVYNIHIQLIILAIYVHKSTAQACSINSTGFYKLKF